MISATEFFKNTQKDEAQNISLMNFLENNFDW